MFKKNHKLFVLSLACTFAQTSIVQAIGTFKYPSWDKIVAQMEKYMAVCPKPMSSCAKTEDISSDPRTIGTKKVGTDNNGAPVYISYATLGTQAPGKPTIVFVDSYFGKNSFLYLQERFSDRYFTVAYDLVGFGQSSKPDPIALDGVHGVPGYSHDQYAIFLHKLLGKLDVQGPIIYVAIDTFGISAIKYAVRYANDPLALTKLVLLDTPPATVTSDNPCSLAFLTTEQARQLTDFYEFNPCAAGCALLSLSFADTECIEYGQELTTQAVNYFSATPASIFRRIFTQTFLEDVSPLVEQVSIPVLYLYGVVNNDDLLSRLASGGLAFSGYCPRCSLNPVVPGTCPLDTPAIKPFRDIRFKSFPGHGTGLWLTVYKEFYREVNRFITGKDLKCQKNPLPINNPIICPACPPVS